MSTASIYTKAAFLISAAKLAQLPTDDGYEVAFVGRSNAGKSSAINVITEQHRLARTSKTPGRTQLINVFALDAERRLIDLPGYGYAKVSEAIKQEWQTLLSNYLCERECLKGLILLMDIRHPLKDTDQQLLLWARDRGLPTHVLLTKADKLNRNPAMQQLIKVRQAMIPYHPSATAQLFSALKRTGLDDARAQLNSWMGVSASA